MKWTIGKVEDVRAFIPIIHKPTGNKVGTTMVAFRRLILSHHNHDGSTTEWKITFNKGKYSIHYPPSVVDIDQKGFHRPNGTKVVPNKETGLSGQTLIQRLLEKFGKKFTKQIITELAS